MPISFQNIAGLYSAYANIQLPWTKLHTAAAVLSSSPNAYLQPGQVQTLAGATPPIASTRAQRYAYRAAVVPHFVMRLPDLIYGTGANQGGTKVEINNGNDAIAHLKDCLQSPLDTGVMGFAQGVFFAKTAAMGAMVGAAIGKLFGADKEAVKDLAALGAGMALGVLWFTPGIVLAYVTGIARAATGTAKFVVVGACYGLGYSIGSVADHFAGQSN